MGILTFHRAINYGAVLQAYALQETLCGMGYDAMVIDYRQPRVERTDRSTFHSDDKMNLLWGRHFRSWWNYDKNKKHTLERRERFDDFLNQFIVLSTPCDSNTIPSMDAYVVGSDQVWNSSICDGLDSVYWGDFARFPNSKLISYAASTSIKDLRRHDDETLAMLLRNFDHISVRERETCNYLNHHFSLKSDVLTVLDPTLLADRSIWDRFDNDKFKNRKYVLCFGARACSVYPTVLRDKAKVLATQMGCDVEYIDFNSDTPVDFVNKYRNAAAVVTSSFHGVAFSLVFNRPLYAVQYGDEQDARYVNVLRSVGAEDMLVDVCQEVHPKDFDYKLINDKLGEIRKESIKYLKCL